LVKMRKGKKYSLDDLGNKYKHLLFDASAISMVLDDPSFPKQDDKAKIVSALRRRDSNVSILKAYVLDGPNNLFVVRETLDVFDPIVAEVKRSTAAVLEKRYGSGVARKMLRFERDSADIRRRRSEKKLVSFLDLLEKRERVLDFRGFHPYGGLVRQIDYIKGLYGLSEADYQVLATSYLVSQKSGSCAVVSNSDKLGYAWYNLVHDGHVSFDRLGCFVRQRRNNFGVATTRLKNLSEKRQIKGI